jgi:hypothetical protein
MGRDSHIDVINMTINEEFLPIHLYTPQQNGVVERMNMTLMEKTRFMLSGVRLGK